MLQTENLRAFHATMSNININSFHMYMYAYYGVHVSDIIRVELLLDRVP